jgi:DNA-binding transcriptional MocR family regulator
VHSYEKLAAAIYNEIAAGGYAVGDYLPGQKVVAAQREVSVGTAHRAMDLLRVEGYLEVDPGRGFRVVATAAPTDTGNRSVSVPLATSESPTTVSPAASASETTAGRVLLNLELRRGAFTVARFMAEANPSNAGELQGLLRDAVRRSGEDADIGIFELDLRSGDGQLTGTFVATGPT